MFKYYDALSNADLQTIYERFDVPSKLISLYGVVNIASKEDIMKTYSGIIETWKTQNLKHHLVVIEFASDFIGRFFESNDLAIVSGTNLTKNGLIIQLVGKQTAIMEFLNAIRGEIKVDRVTTGKGGEGMIERGPSIQQFKVIKTAFENGWYDVPKGISIRDLADKLDLSKSSVAEHLVRAENNIVGNFLENSK